MTYTFFADPGHGWLRVPHAELTRLGITFQVSRYSYMDDKFAYLEEDRDAAIFMEAADDVSIDERHSNDESFVRALPQFASEVSAGYAWKSLKA